MGKLGARVMMAAVLALGAIPLTGCPGGGGFQVWIANGSAEFIVTSIIVEGGGATPPMIELVEDEDGVGTETFRVFGAIPAGPFFGHTVTVTLLLMGTGATPVPLDVTVAVPEVIRPGLIIPIVINGDTIPTLTTEYLPFYTGRATGPMPL